MSGRACLCSGMPFQTCPCVLLLAIAGVSCLRPVEPAPAPPPPPPVVVIGDCGLRATLTELAPRVGYSEYSLTLKNGGDRPVTLVVPGDGSFDGRRTPVLTWIATADGKAVVVEDDADCGMMNRIEADEVFTLAPDAVRELKSWVSTPSLVPGTYELALRYRNDPTLTRGTEERAEVARAVAATQACDVTSNAITSKLLRGGAADEAPPTPAPITQKVKRAP